MNKKARDLIAQIERMFEEEGVKQFEFEHGAKHIEVYFWPPGLAQPRYYSFAGTPGDRRTGLNTVAGIRRIIRATKAGG
jgi:hypothetical protein